MVGSLRAAIVADDDEFFHTGGLLRLIGWGLAAAASVAAAVAVARTDVGARRLDMALAAIGGAPADPQQAATAQLAARVAAAERDARRAIETAQAISTERERLSARLIALEHDVGEVTGTARKAVALAVESRAPSDRQGPSSVQGVPAISTSSNAPLMYPRNDPPAWNNGPAPVLAARPPETAPASPASEAAPSATAGAITPSANGAIAAANVPLPRPSPLPGNNGGAAAVAAAPEKPADAVITTASIPGEASPKAEFGVDLGPALTMARLRSRWAKLAVERPDLVKDLRPLVTVRDTGAGKPVEVRLLVGPMTTVTGATDFCKALASPQYVCRPSVFDGQRLTVQ